jgi:Do/DeqQ family serine protease
MFTRILITLLAITLPLQALAQDTDRALPESRTEMQLSFSPLVKKIAPAVVNIYTKRVVTRSYHPFMNDPMFAPFFENQQFGGRMKKQVEGALGSGVIIDGSGLIVTNSHVVREAQEITVVLNDGREFDAMVALVDEPSDLALLRVDTKGEELPAAMLKPSESLEVGDMVLAIGNPFGVGQTVTSGIVSALARSSLNISDFNFFIQTDAAINPGNSGGPLVSMDGGVIGINSAIYSRDGGSLGIGFAIPSEMVASVIAAEKGGGEGVVRPWLGVTAQPVTNDIAQSLDLVRPVGALITMLHESSPLAKAGLKVGDVVTSVNGKDIHDPSEMKFRMATVPLGQKATMEAIRTGTKKTYEVEAMAAPDKPARDETKLQGAHLLNGAVIANMNPAVAVELGLFGKEEEGVVVLKVSEGTSAARIVAAGDILVEINGKKITKTTDAEKALKNAGQGLSLIVRSQGRTRRLLIR